MKRMLLILMVLASVAMAGDRQINMAMAGDREMKALLVGKWTDGTGNYDNHPTEFWADGKLLWNADAEVHDLYQTKWDIQNGQLIEIRGGGRSDYSYTILFLTKHEFLALVNRGDGRNYIFLKR